MAIAEVAEESKPGVVGLTQETQPTVMQLHLWKYKVESGQMNIFAEVEAGSTSVVAH